MRKFSLLISCVSFALAAEAQSGAPSDRLDLSSWKLTLPVDTPIEGTPDELMSKELKGFVDDRHFFVDGEGSVVFRAHCDGVTTKGSRYPRSELRELSNGRDASWGTEEEKIRTMEATIRVTGLPKKKPHVVFAQIHDARDDVLMCRMEEQTLLIERGGHPDVVLASNHPLGKPFDLRIEAGGGRIRVWFDGKSALDWPTVARGCYFKAGCYTQSNLAKGDKAEAFGEVRISRLVLR